MECSSPEFKAVPQVWPNDDTEEDVDLPVIELKKGSVIAEPFYITRAMIWCYYLWQTVAGSVVISLD